MLQEEVKSLEDRLDSLNADFSSQCGREMALKSRVKDLEKEATEQQALKVHVYFDSTLVQVYKKNKVRTCPVYNILFSFRAVVMRVLF